MSNEIFKLKKLSAILGNDFRGYFSLTFFVIKELTVPGGTVLLIIIEIFCFKLESNVIIELTNDVAIIIIGDNPIRPIIALWSKIGSLCDVLMDGSAFIFCG